MSLINKMLDDLEKRQAFMSDNQDTALDGLCSVSGDDIEYEDKRGSKRIVLSVLLVVCILSIFVNPLGYLDLDDTSDSGRNSSTVTGAISTEQSQPVSVIKNIQESAPVPEEVAKTPELTTFKLDLGLALIPAEQTEKIHSATDDFINEIILEWSDQTIIVSLHLAAEPRYQLYTLNSPERAVIEIDNATYTGIMPDISKVPGISGVRWIQDDGSFKLVLETINTVFIENTKLDKDERGFNLEIRLASESLAFVEPELVSDPAVSDVSEQKIEVIKSRVQRESLSVVDKLYLEGYQQYQDGNVVTGLDKLALAVKQDAGHTNARLILATCLIEQGQRDKAYSLLQEGLNAQPEQTQWARLLAQALMNEGKLTAAREVLFNSIPEATDDPDYHALYAAILQRMEQHNDAAVTYRNILRLHPEKGIWWMGLGISLEAMSRLNDALFAYKNALNGQSLTPDIHQYINRRINILSQQLLYEPA